MEKRKYEKPSTTPLSAVQPVQGSCASGSPEYTVIGTCTGGDYALDDPTGGNGCVTGAVVYPRGICQPGSSAGFSCVSGYGAG